MNSNKVIVKYKQKNTFISFITNIEFKNDSKDPHYEVSVFNKNIKYKCKISPKDGSVKEIKKLAIN